MRLTCPICGERDSREFTYRGDAILAARPDPSDPGAMDAYVHTRANPAGPHQELWHHSMGCGLWLRVTRNTVTHEIEAVERPS